MHRSSGLAHNKSGSVLESHRDNNKQNLCEVFQRTGQNIIAHVFTCSNAMWQTIQCRARAIFVSCHCAYSLFGFKLMSFYWPLSRILLPRHCFFTAFGPLFNLVTSVINKIRNNYRQINYIKSLNFNG